MHGLQAARGASAVEDVASARAPAGPRPARSYAFLLAVAAAVLVLDQITKEVALRSLRDGPVDVIPNVLRFRLTFNPGGAFGLFRDHPRFFLIATIVVVALILVWVRKLDDPRLVPPLGLIVGGGIGNVFDRIFRSHDGRVVDFIDLHVWPVFNVADMAVVLGVAAVLLLGLREPER